ncbi:HesA/MoeB/ThiF family protein [Geminicoccus roseus]|uniref:HesA/MoeB/ThiF family protein n=1 Tax=Geminicoccus roseus TaxID=404900 RepID=UPI000427057E|nr:HesA/MoeB/ThiF family protein [Geminicoccus roseus]
MRDWTEDELARFSRQIVLREIGGSGQDRLLSARVALVGVGGIGAPAAMFLAAAGIGTLRLIDHDRVELSNLHRQVLFGQDDVGRGKVEAAIDALQAASPGLRVEPFPHRVDAGNVGEALAGVDMVLDGTDQFETRVLVADECARAGIPLVSASVQGFDGQFIALRPYLGSPHPSYRCIYPDDPQPGSLPSCTLSGVLGPVAATMAGLAATEIVKLLLELEDPAIPAPLTCYDGLAGMLHRIEIPRSAAAEANTGTVSGTPAYASS